jgi:hypothetical protein
VTSGFDPSFDRKYVMLMPTLSGYRDGATKRMVITHDYSDAYEKLLEDDKGFEMRIADEFQLVIPISEIVTANLFDPIVYELFLDVEEHAKTP